MLFLRFSLTTNTTAVTVVTLVWQRNGSYKVSCTYVWIILCLNWERVLIYPINSSSGLPEASFYDERDASRFHSFFPNHSSTQFAYPIHLCKKLEISVFISSGVPQIARTSCLRLQRSCNQNLGMRTRFVPPGDSTTGANHFRKQGGAVFEERGFFDIQRLSMGMLESSLQE